MPHHVPRKRFGQNFLVDHRVAKMLVDTIGLLPHDYVIEIGPGKGVMTTYLQAAVECLEVVEIDRDLAAFLIDKFSFVLNQTLFNTDVLTFDFTQRHHFNQHPIRVVGNLPYNITTPLLFHLMSHLVGVFDMHVMVQREVAQRLVASTGTRDYGRLSVMMQNAFHIESLCELSPRAFSPQPKVWSTWIRLMPNQDALAPDHIAYPVFSRLVRQAFSKRRKMCRQSMAADVSVADLEALEISPEKRAQNLSVQNYIDLALQIADG